MIRLESSGLCEIVKQNILGISWDENGLCLGQATPTALPEGSSLEERLTFEKWHEDNRKVRSIILISMTNEIQKQYDRLEDVPSIMLCMKDVYAVPDRHIRYAATKTFFGIKMTEGSSMHNHGVKMLSLLEKLEYLKAGLNNDTYIDVILQSLPPSCDPFIVNYNMNGLEKSIHESINMLVQYEATTHKSEPTVLVGEVSTSKGKGKGVRRWKRKKGKGTAVTATAEVLERSRRLSKDEMILRLGDGKAVAAEAVGCLRLVISNHIRIDLKDCYFVPSMVKNIISIPMLDNEGFKFLINKSCFYLVFDDVFHLLGTLVNGLYILQQSNLIMTAQHKRKVDNHKNTQIWHARLGYISKDRIRRLVDSKSLELDNLDHLPTCESCLKEKMTKKPFVGQSAIANSLLLLVHKDVWLPLSIPAKGGFSCFITFIDDHSRYGYVYLMRYKSAVFGRFKEYRLEVENQTNRKIKAFRSGRGGEYLSGEFIDYLKDNGILSQWTPSGTPQLNGVAERRNQTLLDMVRSMMSFTKLPPFFWGYALETVAKLLNIAPSKSVPQTPYEIWQGKPASYKYLGVWGSPAYVKRLVGDKLDSRSSLCRQRDEVLIEESNEEPHHDSTTSFEPTVHTDGVPVHRRLTRESRVPERYEFIGFIIQLDNDPKTYGEAMSDINSDKWFEAMKFEMDSMGSNQVWTLVDPPKGTRPVGCKWVYKRKLGADREVTAFKARLVAKEYTQRPGVDFEETYSPVAMAKSVRILLAIAAWYDYEIWQMDVKTGFLNGFVEEEIFVDQPEGFTAVGEEQKVCHLQRSICGLKQASRSWNTRFDEVIRSYDFIKNDYDPCIYKKISGSSVAYLVLYVYDILLIGNDVKMLGDIKAWLSTQFSMKDMGEHPTSLASRSTGIDLEGC
ncbi:UNVERIFIED_CONTAM: Retrovirus-related Pol polyprotein from transposon RE2 [Sesamum radiatum]|uniref:Retrovirus-related Pol polyprotein from transposon RE2 n=1 Tax=Sesamum radiatum TaxID=300843 RepID=A0AAW2S1C7_SESRA